MVGASGRGFSSMVEVLVSTVLIVIVMMGLMGLQAMPLQGRAGSYQVTKAIELGRDQIRTLEEVPVADLGDSDGISAGEPAAGSYEALLGAIDKSNKANYGKIEGVGFVRVWSAQSVLGNPDFKTVRIWVFWEDRSGQSHNIQLVTQRAG